jgi:type II secretory pathway pseudopilin PulG
MVHSLSSQDSQSSTTQLESRSSTPRSSTTHLGVVGREPQTARSRYGDPYRSEAFGFASRMGCALSLALMLAMGASARQQDQQQDQQASSQQQGQQGQQGDQSSAPPPASTSGQDQTQTPPPAATPPPATPPQNPNRPKYAQQDADKPPYAKDYPAPRAGSAPHAPDPDQYDPDQDMGPDEGDQDRGPGGPEGPGAPDADRGPYRDNRDGGNYGGNNGDNGYPDNGYPAPRVGTRPPNAPYSRNAAPATPAPATLTIPVGTVLQVRMNEYLSSDRNQVGDRVSATLQQPIVVNGYVVARRGQTLVGQVEAAEKAGRVKGTSQLGIELTDMTMVDGQSRPILTELWKGSGGTSHGADAATIGGTTALGAAIGSVADWGRGAAIGAGAGAAAGIGAVLLTRGRPTVIPPETLLTFRLTEPVKVDTTQAAQAFVPVSQRDYDGYGGRRGAYDSRYATQGPYSQGPYAGGPYGPAPYACGYDYPCYTYPAYAYPAYPYYPSIYFGGYYGGGYYGRGFYGRRGRW